MPGENLNLAGTVLDGKLKLESIIGTGEKCVLYSGTHLLLNKPVAVKVFDKADADVVVRSSEQNMRSSQRLQKLLGTGTKGEVGYAVFDLNTDLAAPDMVRVYGLDELSTNYAAAVENARRAAKNALLRKVILLPIVLGFAALVLAIGVPWLTNNLKHSLVGPYQQLLADIGTGTTAALPANDLPLLLRFARSLNSEPVGAQDARNYKRISAAAVQLADQEFRQNNASAMEEAYEAALLIELVPRMNTSEEVMHIMTYFCSRLASTKRPELAKKLFDTYMDRAGNSISVTLRATLFCGMARIYDANGKFEEARKMFDEYAVEASNFNPAIRIDAALNAYHLKNTSRQRQLVSEALAWVSNQTVRDLETRYYLQLYQMFVGLAEMQDVDNAIRIGLIEHDMAVAHTPRMAGLLLGLPPEKVSSSKCESHLFLLESMVGTLAVQKHDWPLAEKLYALAAQRKLDPVDANSPEVAPWTNVANIGLKKVRAAQAQ
jgi:hypothetical protein